MVFKIDFEKAYDHVDWGFLNTLREKRISLRREQKPIQSLANRIHLHV